MTEQTSTGIAKWNEVKYKTTSCTSFGKVYLPNPRSLQMDVIIVRLILFIPSGMIEIIIIGIDLKQYISVFHSMQLKTMLQVRNVESEFFFFFLVNWNF